jgi:hypothetical protein
MRSIYFFIAVLLIFESCDTKVKVKHKNTEPKIKAVSLLTKVPIEDSTLSSFKKAGITHIVPIVFGLMKNPHSPEVTPNYGSGWYNERDKGIYDLAKRAKNYGMNLILKIQLSPGEKYIENGSLGKMWFENPIDMQIWETSYRKIVMHYAVMASKINSPLLVIGCETDRLASGNETYWRNLIKDVRNVYKGKLTYGAGGIEGYKTIRFWDALDYIGIHAYYNLSDEKSPSLKELMDGWSDIKDDLAELSGKWNKPIFFSEFGCRSTEGAAHNMWQWERASRSEMMDLELQSRIYESMFKTFWKEPWFSGVAIWSVTAGWDAKTLIDKQRGPTPQFKPAWKVLSTYFKGSVR